MAEKATPMPIQVDTGARLNQNLALLHAGSTVSLEISTPAGQKAKFRTIFIGYLPKQYLLVQFPEGNKIGRFAQYIKQGTSITIRGLIEGHEGAVLAFMTGVKQTLQIPSRIMVLDFPHTVTLQNLRSSIRIDTQINAKVRIDQEYWQTTITNLSIKGGQLNIDNGDKLVLTENKTIEIIVENDEAAGNIKLNAVICNLKKKINGLAFGVKFSADSRPEVIDLLLLAITSENQPL